MTITPENLVRREVFYCVSSLVSTLASHSYTERGDLLEMCEQACELAAPIPDYESAATDAGWKRSKDGWRKSVPCGWLQHPGPVEMLCDVEDIEPRDREVFEHWIVSDWLADKLEAMGEKVDKDFAGMTVRARTTTGQGIASDWVIEQICADLNKPREVVA